MSKPDAMPTKIHCVKDSFGIFMNTHCWLSREHSRNGAKG